MFGGMVSHIYSHHMIIPDNHNHKTHFSSTMKCISYAVPFQLTEKEGPGNKMADKKGNTVVYEPPS